MLTIAQLKHYLHVVTLACVLAVAAPIAVITVVGVGCKSTPQQLTYNTLYATEKAVVGAYDAYLYGVIKGTIPTNDVPHVSRLFNRYQNTMSTAIATARFNWTSPTPDELKHQAEELLLVIANAKNQ